MSLNPHITNETASKITLAWTPDLTGQGYRLYVDGVAVSRSFKPDLSQSTFSKPSSGQHRYGVQKMDVVDALEEVTHPAPDPDPDPEPEPGDAYYLAANGSDSNDGSQGAPWATFGKAVSSIPLDQAATVIVTSGKFTNVKITDVKRTARLTFKAASQAVELAGRVDEPSTTSTDHGLVISNSSRFRFEGFLFTGGFNIRSAASFIDIVGCRCIKNQCVINNEAYDVLIEDNEFTDNSNGSRAFTLSGNSTSKGMKRLTIRGNRFHHLTNDACAIYWSFEDVLIEDNVFDWVHRVASSDTHCDALQIAPQGGGVSSGFCIVRRNKFYDADQATLVKDGTTNGLVYENNLLVRSGNIDANGGFACMIFNAPACVVRNNTLEDGYIYFRSTGANWTTGPVVNNITPKLHRDPPVTYGSADYNMVNRAEHLVGYTPGPHDIDGVPTFVNPSSDFHLADGSKGIDAGSTSAAPSEDLDGTARPQGASADMGCYER